MSKDKTPQTQKELESLIREHIKLLDTHITKHEAMRKAYYEILNHLRDVDIVKRKPIKK